MDRWHRERLHVKDGALVPVEGPQVLASHRLFVMFVDVSVRFARVTRVGGAFIVVALWFGFACLLCTLTMLLS